ncbi:MAG TPA: hypothetical protein PLE99_00290 [Candidatus Thiothrix moscowensis]|uniref:hypothetical protein n=1 Tax=unclassified Thiothrix TaxID=2636184 RepID=UPI001A323849|nr:MULTISPECIES: hypothetical protein [unclassified Thiothrix]MBJ6610410.1 hypothetical protein [Candidatus Thiothrix moscowensis]HRJ51176.1 hypothetical protein [Candidatus Thiothrix moscowensis]HRJ91769.1 hypothetical protein [Candidatus Thiothrix moscowensis]
MQDNQQVVSADSARKMAKIFYYGNILSVLIPFPVFILWFGAGILVYAMFRHHPNPRVGYFTQIAAYQYYGLAGGLVPILTFAPGDFFVNWWWALWILCAAILLPLSVRQIMRVNREVWQDTAKSH